MQSSYGRNKSIENDEIIENANKRSNSNYARDAMKEKLIGLMQFVESTD